MIVTILNVTVEPVPGKNYKKAEVAYKDDQGKVNGKKIMSFVNEGVFATLQTAQAGDTFEVTTEKDKNGYWQWVGISKVEGGSKPEVAGSAGKALPSPKSTYETPEERAQKQVYIVRQSAINAAIAYSAGVKALKSVDDVIATAKQFESYVFDTVMEQEEGEVQ